MNHLDALRADRAALEEHMNIDGGCRRQMFLGDCPDCARYWEIDDQIIAAEIADQQGASPVE